MTIREDLVANAVTFLQDPSVAASPIESRVAFLESKNLTAEEVAAALARASGESPPQPSHPSYAPQGQVARQPSPAYGGYPSQQYPPWPQAPPEVPKRDWRDYFIMATVMGGVSYGLYQVAKRYVIPLIAPPTPPQLEQDKAAIDASFEQAFTLLDTLAKDTEKLKTAEEERTQRLDSALEEVESVVAELKSSSLRRENESRRITDEVRGLRDLIPKAIDSQKESTDSRLQELNAELKSLKKLMGQRLAPPSSSPAIPQSSHARAPSTTPLQPASTVVPATLTQVNATPAPVDGPKPASVSNGTATEASASIAGRSPNPFHAVVPSGRASIPAWQMAAAKKAEPPAPAAVIETPVSVAALETLSEIARITEG